MARAKSHSSPPKAGRRGRGRKVQPPSTGSSPAASEAASGPLPESAPQPSTASQPSSSSQPSAALAPTDLFAAVAEGSIVGIYVIQDGKFRYVNPALAKILGYRREELEGGLGPADLTHPDDRDKVAEFIRRRIAGEVASVHYTFRALHKSGRELHCEALGQLVQLEGKPAVAGTLLDISERDLAQQGLLESEALFRGVAEKSPNAIFINQRGKVVYANSSAVELLGYSQAELTGPGFDFFKLIAPESLDAVRTYQRQHQVGQEVAPYECRLLTRDGRVVDSIIATRLIRFEGELATLGIVTDVTERKEAERELRRLLGQEQQHRRLAEAVARVGLSLTAQLELPELLDLISKESTEVFGVSSAFVWMLEGEELVGFAGHGQGREHFVGQRLALDDSTSLGPMVVNEARPIYVNQARSSTHVNQALLELFHAQTILGVPLIRAGRVEGALMLLDSEDPDRFQDQDLETAMVLGGQMALAIESAQHLRQDRRRLQQLAALIQASTVISSTLDLDAILTRVAEEMCKAIDATSAYICTYDPHSKSSTVVAEFYGPLAIERESDLGHTYDLEAVFPGSVSSLELGDSRIAQVDDPDLSESERSHLLHFGGKSTLTVPFESAGQIHAYAELWESRAPRVFSPEEIELCLAIGRQAAIALENGRLYQQAQTELSERWRAERELAKAMARIEEALERSERMAATEEALRDSAAALNSTLDLQEVLDRILSSVGRVVPSDTVDIMLLEHDPAGDVLVGARGMGYGERGQDGWLETVRLPVKDIPNFRRLVRTGTPYAIPEVKDSPDWVVFPETLWIQSYAAAPIKAKGEMVGILNLCSETPGFYSQSHAELLQVFADQAAVAIQNAQLFTQATQELKERQRAELELRRLSDFNESILEEMADGVAVQDRDGNFTYINPAAAALFGQSREGLIGQHWTQVILPEDRQLVEAADARRLQGRSDRYEVELLRKDGTRVPVLVSGRPRSESGEFVGTIAVFTDISERKRSEEALRESNARFRNLFEASPDAVLLLDPHDRWIILDCNVEACRMNGYSREELLGQSVDLLNLAPARPGEREEYLQQIRQLGTLHLETFHRRKSGEVFPVEVSTTLITLGGREVVLGIDRDITERRRTEEAEREFLRTKEEFLLSASHSLRTPLHTLMGFLELLAAGKVQDPEQHRDFLRRALSDAGHLGELLEDVLGTAQLEAGSVQLELQTLRPVELLAETLASLQGLARDKGIELTWSVGDIPAGLRADRTRLRQALGNLIENAIHYSQSGTIVRVEAAGRGSGMEFRVIDQGPGISPADQAAMFEKPYLRSAGRPGGRGGIGLGLYLTRTIVEAHGGTVRVESDVGHGSTFVIALPG
jgi:protein-histidine pros-kinase